MQISVETKPSVSLQYVLRELTMKRGRKYHDYKNCVQGAVRVRIYLASKRYTSVKMMSAFQRHFDWFVIESPRKMSLP